MRRFRHYEHRLTSIYARLADRGLEHYLGLLLGVIFALLLIT